MADFFQSQRMSVAELGALHVFLESQSHNKVTLCNHFCYIINVISLHLANLQCFKLSEYGGVWKQDCMPWLNTISITECFLLLLIRII